MAEPYATPLLTEDQWRLMHEILPRVPCIMSMVGSGFILYSIVRPRWETGKFTRPTYHRMLIAMATVDIMSSFWTALGRVAVPKEIFGGKGTQGM